jgi:hypothetical protein
MGTRIYRRAVGSATAHRYGNPKLRDYKLYNFLNSFRVTPEEARCHPYATEAEWRDRVVGLCAGLHRAETVGGQHARTDRDPSRGKRSHVLDPPENRIVAESAQEFSLAMAPNGAALLAIEEAGAMSARP